MTLDVATQLSNALVPIKTGYTLTLDVATQLSNALVPIKTGLQGHPWMYVYIYIYIYTLQRLKAQRQHMAC